MARDYIQDKKVAICDEDAICLGTARCACSHCRTESAFGHFDSIPDLSCSFPVPGSNHRHSGADHRPNVVVFPDVHRCKTFPCPICDPTSRRIRIHPTGQCKITDQYGIRLVAGASDHEMMDLGVPFGSFGDGGHTCRKFPCPVCHPGRARCSPVF